MDDFMRRPTEVFVSYMATAFGYDEDRVRKMMRLGRIAMAMEVMTVAQLIEDYSLLPTKEDTISVLQTLIIDQELLEDADAWYKTLSQWRRIKLDPDVHGSVQPASDDSHPDAQPSPDASPRGAPLRHEQLDALLDTGQTKDPPSDD